LASAFAASWPCFDLAGADKKWVVAQAKIDGDDVLVWSDQVPNPVAVRYAWAQNPQVNLYNKEGFPAVPFRTQDWPVVP
jgi:sialate O-acetylesterase